jgi:ATP-dependent helicase Lhr and Lhr-like helicase
MRTSSASASVSVEPVAARASLRSCASMSSSGNATGTAIFSTSLGPMSVLARDFFAMFQGDQEWRLAFGSKTLGTIPLSNPVAKGNLVVFPGRRWQIVDVDERAHVLAVAPHKSGQIPKFEGASAEETHDELLLEMRRVYESDDVPTYLDDPAKALLSQARAAYRRSDLARVNVLDAGSAVHLFPWVGSAAASVIAVALATLGVSAEANGLSVVLPGVGMDEAKKALAKLASSAPEDLARIEENALGLCNAKYDEYVPDALLRRLWGRRNAKAISAIPETARELATNTVSH